MMDDFSIVDERIDSALTELSIINKYLGGRTVSESGIKKIAMKKNASFGLKILDIGAGGSDSLLNIKNHHLKIFGLDINSRVCKYLFKQNNTAVVCADALNLPFKQKYFDICHASLFMHHLSEVQIKLLIKNLQSLCNYGIVINDLRRSVFALIGIWFLTKLFSKNQLVKNDAPLSVKRGFVKKELIEILEELKIFNYEIKKKWAFRWLVIIYC